MLEDHKGFIEEVIRKTSEKDHLKSTKKSRKEAEKAVIESILEVTDLSREEVVVVMESLRKKRLAKQKTAFSASTLLRSFVQHKRPLFILMAILLTLPLATPLWSTLRNTTTFDGLLSFLFDPKAVPKAPLKPAFELTPLRVTKLVIDRSPVKDIEIEDFNQDGYIDILANSQDVLRFYEMGSEDVLSDKALSSLNGNVDVGTADFDLDGSPEIFASSERYDDIKLWSLDDGYYSRDGSLSETYGASIIRVLESNSHGQIELLANTQSKLERLRYNHETKVLKKNTLIQSHGRTVPAAIADMAITILSRLNPLVMMQKNFLSWSD